MPSAGDLSPAFPSITSASCITYHRFYFHTCRSISILAPVGSLQFAAKLSVVGIFTLAEITQHALDFIGATASERPLYAHISYVQPHGPKCPPGDYMRHVDADKIPDPVPAEWHGDPDAPGYFRDKKPARPKNARYQRHCYFADIVHLDRQLGRVTEALEKAGRLDNTYLILLADHGELLLDHGFSGKEERHYDACIRVPMVVAGPGLSQGVTRDDFVQHEDICPTVLDMTDQRLTPMPTMGGYLKMEADELPILPGRSMLPLCRGEQVDDWRSAAYCESYNPIWSNDVGDWARTIRTADYRYTFYPNGNGEQLFDLKNDPDEQRNLFNDPAHADVRRDLRDQLLELIVLQDYPKTRRECFALGVH